ncbi:ABC transporter permease [Pedobacter sp. SYP-B3415]|uniref:ABC transporter permease n=1 Tax=Pedobacter sp. SYP-B3415 TaxID=2496641 RepID=UPI00101D7861|nr:ABC transporter permease [Pedobacter sp. SYP-B3415]
MFKLNLRIALRNLWKNKGFALINISGLTIGLASCLMLLLYVSYEWQYDRQFSKIDRIYGVCKNYSNNGNLETYGPVSNALPNLLVPTALQTIPGIEKASRTNAAYKLLSRGKHAVNMTALYADPAFLDIFDYNFIEGNATALSDPGAVILTDQAARKMFGAERAVGKAVTWDNKHMLKVGGVISDPEPNQTYRFDVIMNWTFMQREEPGRNYNNWGNGFSNALILLKPGANFEAADRAIRRLIRKNQPENNTEAFLFPFAKTHLYNDFRNGKAVGGSIDQLRIFLMLAGCVLAIACINYMNLSTARSEKRAHEVGVRKALGSDRMSLSMQFLAEAVLLTCFAMIFAFVLVELCLPFFNNLLNTAIVVDYQSPYTWLLLFGLTIITALLAGSYPAFYLSSFVPVKALKGFKAGQGSLSVRRLLVVLQFACSVCMIVGAIAIYRQVSYLRNKPLGFDETNLIELSRNGKLGNESTNALFKTELLKSGAVTAVSGLSTSLTNGGNNSDSFSWPGMQPNEKIVMNIRETDPGLDATLRVGTVAGRGFDPSKRSDSSGVILNESAARAMNLNTAAIGKEIRYGNMAFTILGIWKDFSYQSSAYRVSPTLFFMADTGRRKTNTLLLRLNPAVNGSQALSIITSLYEKFNPGFSPEPRFISDALADTLRNERRLGTLANIFGGFAVFISCLGLLGLALFMAEQRSKEVSIRKVLGADLLSILVLLNKDFIRLVLTANAIACPIAWILLNRWLQGFDYRQSLGLWPFAIAILASLLVALAAVSLQTWKVARANPADALKYE